LQQLWAMKFSFGESTAPQLSACSTDQHQCCVCQVITVIAGCWVVQSSNIHRLDRLKQAAVDLLLYRDVSAVKDGKVESYVCMGYEQGARVTCLAFEAAGSLLVGGEC